MDKVRCGDPGASKELYRLFNVGLKYFKGRRGIRDVDDKVEEVLLAAAMGIRKGELEDPNRLGAFILGIAHPIICSAILPSAPAILENRGRLAQVRQALAALLEREREIVTRFYTRGQKEQQVCADMNLTPTQFRLLNPLPSRRHLA